MRYYSSLTPERKADLCYAVSIIASLAALWAILVPLPTIATTRLVIAVGGTVVAIVSIVTQWWFREVAAEDWRRAANNPPE